MIRINWKKEYQKDFLCPKCSSSNLYLYGNTANNKRCFKCPKCKKRISTSCDLKNGYLTSRMEAYRLGCPSEICDAKQMAVHQLQYGKKYFVCKVCGATAVESNNLSKNNLSRYAHK